jgi:hypothetical protein
MSNNPTFDPDLFQKLLASAFAVQESGMKSQSLAAIVELERSIRCGHLDADGAMYLVAEWARSVANASGVVIGRLKADQLVYAAGSGSTASYIGRRVMATFIPSAPSESRQEILRVEDVWVEGGIKAAICRQFGVKSLLILPIFSGHAVTGVLQVLFHEAHKFQDQELCTYRLLSQLVGEAISQPAQPEENKNVEPQPLLAQPSVEKFPAPIREPHHRTPRPPARKSAVCESCGASIAEAREAWAIERSRHENSSFLQRVSEVPLPRNTWRAGLGAASVFIAVCWILFTGRPPITSSLSASPPPKSEQPSSLPLATRTSSTSVPVGEAPGHVAPEVTVRHFASTVRKPAVPSQANIKDFGDDVTVRHFAPKAAVVRKAADSDVRQVSDDVTVRYFRPKSVGLQNPPATSGAQPPVSH